MRSFLKLVLVGLLPFVLAGCGLLSSQESKENKDPSSFEGEIEKPLEMVKIVDEPTPQEIEERFEKRNKGEEVEPLRNPDPVKPDEVLNFRPTENDFAIYKVRDWEYNFDFWYKGNAGKVWLITYNKDTGKWLRNSSSAHRKRTARVVSKSEELQRYDHPAHGSLRVYRNVELIENLRFELWHEDDKTGEETMLAFRNYEVETWIR